MPKPILSLDAVRLHRTPLYDKNRVIGFASDNSPEVRGTLYLQDGGTMKLWQPLTRDEQQELEALLERAAARILSSMTAALGPDEVQDPPNGDM
ncbi:MAG: hypothetical protein ABI670_18050 [Chloroflexota bacterium]